MKRRIFSFLLIVLFTFIFISCSKEETKNNYEMKGPINGKYASGTYEGKANGYGGEVTATVVLSANRIESIMCTGDKETESIGYAAITELPKEIISKQSVQVDAITGATVTSIAVKEAVTQALTKAGVDVEALVPVMGEAVDLVTPIEEKRLVDLVVIGAGGAGITAALEAKAHGLDVIILEKEPTAGGNTQKASRGISLMNGLVEKAEEESIEILYNTEATKLIREKNYKVEAVGISKNYSIQCHAVILATGGFGANQGMVQQYNPSLYNYVSVNAVGTTGDGIWMAKELGAKLIHMDQILICPTVELNKGIPISKSLLEQGAILVNQNGERFFNELSTNKLVSKAIMLQEGSCAYLIFDQQVRERLPVVEEYLNSDLVEEEVNFSKLAKKLGIDTETLINCIADWNNTIMKGSSDIFQRVLRLNQTLSTSPYYAIRVKPAIYQTIGGVEITKKAEVINEEGEVIPGLFAAGEIVGGIHNENDIKGNTMDDSFVFGEVAGISAAQYIAVYK